MFDDVSHVPEINSILKQSVIDDICSYLWMEESLFLSPLYFEIS